MLAGIDLDRLVNAMLALITGLVAIFATKTATKEIKKNNVEAAAAAATEPAGERIELAGAVIGSKDVNRLIESFDRLTTAVIAINAQLPLNRDSMEMVNESVEDLHLTIKETARDIRDATRELGFKTKAEQPRVYSHGRNNSNNKG